ncbi:MAG: hypothetical protein IT319_19445 [Anaerolineae bacterium]|nr:hypothetical protein [Anaerolineae bacterium]
MRNFQTLDQAVVDTATGVITFTVTNSDGAHPTIALRREGEYAPISASYGSLEIALRLRVRELIRTISHIQPNDGLNVTRQVGTGDCFLGLGLRSDGSLVVRPTIIGDASGYFCLNLVLAPEATAALRRWLGDENTPA